MKFQTWWCTAKPAEKERLAKTCKTSVSYLSQIAHGHRNAGIKTAHKLVRAINDITPESKLTIFDVRTDLSEVA